MNTNLVFDASGYIDGLSTVLGSFESMLDGAWQSDVIGELMSSLTIIVTIVLLWYGVRAILRAVKSTK